VIPMTDFLKNSGWLADLLDIGVVAFIIYRVILSLKGTMAPRIIIGLVLLLFCRVVSRFSGFQTFNWILDNFFGSLIILLVIIFQHDIRRALFAFSRNRPVGEQAREGMQGVIEELAGAAESLAGKRIGALMVIEQSMTLNPYLVVGTEIDAKVTSELITSIYRSMTGRSSSSGGN